MRDMVYSFRHTDGRQGDMVISCVCAFVCLCVRALKGKRLELSTPKLVQM